MVELTLGIFALCVIALFFAGLEKRDNNSDLGKEILSELTGFEKTAKESGPNLLVFIVVVLIAVFAVGLISSFGG